MKNKKIIIGAICLALILPLGAKAKTLYRLFVEELGFFPSVSERITLAESCGIFKYRGNRDQNIELKDCIENGRRDFVDEETYLGMSPPDKLSKTIREDITAGTNESTITVDPLVTLQGHRLTMNDISSTSPRLFFRIGSGDTVTWGYCTGMTDNTTTYDLTGCQLGLNDYGPGTTTNTANINSHSAGEAFVITNSHHWFDYYLPDVMTTSTINNRWIFPTGYQHPRLSSDTDPTENAQLVQKGYADRLANQGAATSTESVAGISEQATQLEMASSTQFDANNPHFMSSEYATTTPYAHTNIGNHAVVGKNNGFIDQEWFNLAENWAFTGNVTTTHATSTSFFSTTVSTTNLYIDSKLADTLVGGGNADTLHNHNYGIDSTYFNYTISASSSDWDLETGSPLFRGSEIELKTTASEGVRFPLFPDGTDTMAQFDDTKDYTFQTRARFVAVATGKSAGFGFSNDGSIFRESNASIDETVGFYVDDIGGGDVLYALTANGTATTTALITGITLSNWNTYKVVFDRGVNAKFYVNGVLKQTIATTLPGTATDMYFWAKIDDTSEDMRLGPVATSKEL